MKPMPVDYLAEMEEAAGSTIAMDVDEVETLEVFGYDGLAAPDHQRLSIADADFFNSFDDDFDDSDIS